MNNYRVIESLAPLCASGTVANAIKRTGNDEVRISVDCKNGAALTISAAQFFAIEKLWLDACDAVVEKEKKNGK